ncbi:uncharacterized protein [Cherax quadricarinatus]
MFGSSVLSDSVTETQEHIIPVTLVEQQQCQTQTSDEKSFTKQNEMSHCDQLKSFTSLRNKMTANADVSSKRTTEARKCSSDNKSDVTFNIEEVNADTNINNQDYHSKTNTVVDNEVDKTKSIVNRHYQGHCENSRSVNLNRILPVSLKGTFFNDSFFEDSRESFVTAVKNVLKKTREGSYLCDDITSYRNLRQRDLRSENQAVHVEEDLTSMKIVVDVQDFIGGDIKVEVVGGKELVVEGRTKSEDGASATSSSFLLRFSLPQHADLETISSAMSSDGVLTIITPKLQQTVGAGTTNNKEMFVERQSRLDHQSDGEQSWEEKKVQHSAKESEGCSSRSFSSAYRSQHQYSSNRNFKH